jgi:hypothetical protein
MVDKIAVTLEWQGPLWDPSAFEGRAGIYLVLCGIHGTISTIREGSEILLDIGQTGRGEDRFRPKHGREDCWEKNTPAGFDRFYKFAHLDSDEFPRDQREIIECCLRYHNKPKCGEECKDNYPYDKEVNITNIGSYEPLEKESSCP